MVIDRTQLELGLFVLKGIKEQRWKHTNMCVILVKLKKLHRRQKNNMLVMLIIQHPTHGEKKSANLGGTRSTFIVIAIDSPQAIQFIYVG